MIGVDVLPAQPPRGVSTIQGDFLSPAIQAEVRSYVLDPDRGRPRASRAARTDDEADDTAIDDDKSYIDLERDISDADEPSSDVIPKGEDGLEATEPDSAVLEKEVQAPQQDSDGRVVDVVLSDMSEPWDQTAGFSIKSISDPYRRMMNVSGARFRDHAGSMVRLLAIIQVSHLLMLTIQGSLHCRTVVLLRHAATRRAFCVQILPGWRG